MPDCACGHPEIAHPDHAACWREECPCTHFVLDPREVRREDNHLGLATESLQRAIAATDHRLGFLLLTKAVGRVIAWCILHRQGVA